MCLLADQRRSLIAPRLQHAEKRFLRNLDLAEGFHSLLAFLLLLEEFAFAGDVAAVAFGRDVFAQGGDRLARDDLAADGRLQRDLRTWWRGIVLFAARG